MVTESHVYTLSQLALSGRIGKVVASHAEVADWYKLNWDCTNLYYARGVQHEGEGCDQLNGSTFFVVVVDCN